MSDPIRVRLAQIGSISFHATVEEGRIDLTAMSDHHTADPGVPRQLGCTLMFDDLDSFEEAGAAVLKTAKPKRGAAR